MTTTQTTQARVEKETVAKEREKVKTKNEVDELPRPRRKKSRLILPAKDWKQILPGKLPIRPL
jgi:hypothetical protein